jgi:hypothetical protein
MNFKTTYVLFGLLAAMLGVLAVVLITGPTAPKGEGYLFPAFKDKGVKPGDIDKVVIQRKTPAGSDLVFERQPDKSWKITSPRALPADSAAVNRLIDAIAEARIDAEAKPGSLQAAGLDAPTRVIRLSGKGKEDKEVDLTLTLGETTKGGSEAVTYVLTSDAPKTPQAVRKDELSSAGEGLNFFRARTLLAENADNVREVKLSQGKKAVVFRKEKSTWRMVEPPYGDADIGDLLGSLSGLSVGYTSDKDNDYVKDGVTNLAEYNLDPAKAEVLRIEVKVGEGDKAKTRTLLVGTSKKVGEKYYAALDEGKTKDVVKVPVSSVEPFVKVLDDPAARRNKNLVQLESFKTPDAVLVKNTYGEFDFFKPEGAAKWEMYRAATKAAVDEKAVNDLIDALTKEKAESFPDAKRYKELGLEKPDAVVKVYAEALDKPDPKKPGKPALKKAAEPAAELRFGNREGGKVAVERVWGKDKTVVMAPEKVFDLVRRNPLAYYEKKVPSFAVGGPADQDVTRVLVERPGETLELTRDKPAEPWTMVRPAQVKGRKANPDFVRNVLDDLNNLSAREVVAEKADAAALKEYGLASPAYKVLVSVTKDKKTTTHEYDLGKEEGGKGVYAKQGGKDAVYLVGPEVLTTLKREPRDTTVFDFKADDVKEVKFTGWAEVVGKPATLTVEKKDGKWVSKDVTPLDDQKVANLVAALSHLTAERFVPSGKKLTLGEDALQVQVTLANKKVLELTVGGADGSSYYAKSNELKGDVFLVAKDLFDKVRERPAFFKK